MKKIRRRGPRRTPIKPAAPRKPEFDSALSIVRLAVGAASLASDELLRRLPESSPGRPDPPLGLGDLAAGLAVEGVIVARRVGSAAARRSGSAGTGLGRVMRLPVVRAAARPARLRYRRLQADVRRLSARGRSERLAGRRMVERLLSDMTASAFNGIARVVVTEVTRSPAIADLVRTESTGIATDTILDVRTSSEQADDRLEGMVHSFLHRGPRNGERDKVRVASRGT